MRPPASSHRRAELPLAAALLAATPPAGRPPSTLTEDLMRGVGIAAVNGAVNALHAQQGAGIAGFGAGLGQGLIIGAIEAANVHRHIKNNSKPRTYYGTRLDGPGTLSTETSFFSVVAAGIITTSAAALVYVAHMTQTPLPGLARRPTLYADCVADEDELINYMRYKHITR